MLKDIGRVRSMRKKLGLTQTELADKAGVSQSLIAKIENGSTAPSYVNGRKILDKLEEEMVKNTTDKKAKEVHSEEVLSLKPDDKIETALEMMDEEAVSQMPVIENGSVVGGITESGLLKNYDKIERDLPVKSMMDPPFPIIAENAELDVVKKLLVHYPCVLTSKKGQIVGIITKVDILGEI
ncbi:MAG: CBS domain-containing protein [Candidatus Saliniplasma sp.]